MGSVRGDFAKLHKIEQKIAQIRDGKVQTAMRKVLAEEGLTQVRLGFRESRDPYGVPWAPLQHRSGKALIKTSRLRNSYTTRPTSKGFRLGTNVHYAGVHQNGWDGRTGAWSRKQAVDARGKFASTATDGKRDASGRFLKRSKRKAVGFRVLNFQAGRGGIPARPMVPTKSRGGLGHIWTKAFHEAAATVFQKFKR